MSRRRLLESLQAPFFKEKKGVRLRALFLPTGTRFFLFCSSHQQVSVGYVDSTYLETMTMMQRRGFLAFKSDVHGVSVCDLVGSLFKCHSCWINSPFESPPADATSTKMVRETLSHADAESGGNSEKINSETDMKSKFCDETSASPVFPHGVTAGPTIEKNLNYQADLNPSVKTLLRRTWFCQMSNKETSNGRELTLCNVGGLKGNIYKVMLDEYGDVLKDKARLVAKGYRQEEDGCQNAFLTGDLQEEVLVSQPEGFEDQELRAWYDTPSKFLLATLFLHGAWIPTKVDRLKQWTRNLMGWSQLPTRFRGMVGSLMYLTPSRPDLVFAVCMCARYQAKPTKKHLEAIKRIFRYLKGTINMGLWYPKNNTMSLQLMQMRIHADVGFEKNFSVQKIPLSVDNKSAIALSCNNVQLSRFKHIDIRHHFIREQVENGVVELYFVKTNYQLADILTKALPRERFEFLLPHGLSLSIENGSSIEGRVLFKFNVWVPIGKCNRVLERQKKLRNQIFRALTASADVPSSVTKTTDTTSTLQPPRPPLQTYSSSRYLVES
ncbi:hypothetical protein Tco_0466598 [Tanacetum coccineum]